MLWINIQSLANMNIWFWFKFGLHLCFNNVLHMCSKIHTGNESECILFFSISLDVNCCHMSYVQMFNTFLFSENVFFLSENVFHWHLRSLDALIVRGANVRCISSDWSRDDKPQRFFNYQLSRENLPLEKLRAGP